MLPCRRSGEDVTRRQHTGRVTRRRALCVAGLSYEACGLLLTVRAGRGSRRLLIAHIRQQLDFYPTIFGAAGSGAVAGHLLILTDSDEVEPVRRDVVLRLQVLGNGVGAALAELIAVAGISARVCSVGQFKDLATCAG